MTGARRRAVVTAADLAVVVAFVAIGRSAHGHGDTAAGVVSTAWPFVAGLAVGSFVAGRMRAPLVLGGVVTAVSTVAVGMGLRVVAGQGTAVAFVAVALGFLGAAMAAWRLCAAAVRRHMRVEPAPPAGPPHG